MFVSNYSLTIKIPPSGKKTRQIVNAFFGNSSDTTEHVANYCFENDHVKYDYFVLHEAIENIEQKINQNLFELHQTEDFKRDMEKIEKFIFYFKQKQRGNFEDKLFSTEVLILINVIIVFFENKYHHTCSFVDKIC